MLYIVEVHPDRSPTSWVAADKDEIVAVLEAAHIDSQKDYTVWDKQTPREHIQNMGCETLDEFNKAYSGTNEITAIVQAQGLDAPMYWNTKSESWQAEPICKTTAYLDDAEKELLALLLFDSDEEAKTALSNPLFWQIQGGIESKQALQKLVEQYAEPAL